MVLVEVIVCGWYRTDAVGVNSRANIFLYCFHSSPYGMKPKLKFQPILQHAIQRMADGIQLAHTGRIPWVVWACRLQSRYNARTRIITAHLLEYTFDLFSSKSLTASQEFRIMIDWPRMFIEITSDSVMYTVRTMRPEREHNQLLTILMPPLTIGDPRLAVARLIEKVPDDGISLGARWQRCAA